MEALSSKKGLKFKLPSKMKKNMKMEARTPPKRPPKREKNAMNLGIVFDLEKNLVRVLKMGVDSAADP